MRSNGHDGEQFSARFTTEEEPSLDDEGRRPDSVPPPEAARPSRAPKARAKKPSVAPKSAALTGAEHDAAAARPSKKAPAKRAKRPSTAPKSRRAPASSQTASPSISPLSVQAPLSRDPKTTLRDHPEQQSAARSVRAAASSFVPSRGREDEISIPPTSSDPPVDLDDRFFAEGEAVHRAHEAEAKRASLQPRVHVEDLEQRVPVVMVPPERRQKLTNYVKMAVGFCAVLCLAAGIRVTASHVTGAAGSERIAVAAPAASPPSPVQASVVAAPVAPPPPAQTAPAAQPAAAAPAPEPPAAVQEAPAVPTKSAKEEKEDARRFLEHGKRKDAIEAGERSVALDPTDAEAWLILGSAQQDAGKWKEGRESYNQCVKQAKVGPIGECRMMLR
jgi:hypothetical protein